MIVPCNLTRVDIIMLNKLADEQTENVTLFCFVSLELLTSKNFLTEFFLWNLSVHILCSVLCVCGYNVGLSSLSR